VHGAKYGETPVMVLVARVVGDGVDEYRDDRYEEEEEVDD
jgi:hypothetical protein